MGIRDSQVKIVSDGTSLGTKVYAGGVDLSDSITSVTWSCKAGGVAQATITCYAKLDAVVDGGQLRIIEVIKA